jgi:hypothetical protein
LSVPEISRLNEWFVPKFGPPRFRAFIGMLFLPYTGMCVSFAVIGSVLAANLDWNRTLSIVIIYFLSLGISAHAADAYGSRSIKPWSNFFSKKELGALIIVPIAISYVIGAYYIILYSPVLALFAVVEGFFLFAYNFEFFKGKLHNRFWLSISWGSLPVLTGYAIQNAHDWYIPILIGVVTGTLTYIHDTLSRPYKELKRQSHNLVPLSQSQSLEAKLKTLSTSVIAFAILCVVLRALVA